MVCHVSECHVSECHVSDCHVSDCHVSDCHVSDCPPRGAQETAAGVAHGLECVATWLRAHLRGVDAAAPAETEPCMYTWTTDGDFIIDTLAPDVHVGAGFSGHGFKLGPVVGLALADLAMGGTCEFDLGPFRADRRGLGRGDAGARP